MRPTGSFANTTSMFDGNYGQTFDEIIGGCEADIRKLANISSDYQILFLQGGASLQFSMVPMNLLPAGGKADYIVTGSWSKKAVKEAQKSGIAQVACTTEADNFTRIPQQSELKLDPGAAYVHFTSNETIHGVEWMREPEAGAVDGFIRAHRSARLRAMVVPRTIGASARPPPQAFPGKGRQCRG